MRMNASKGVVFADSREFSVCATSLIRIHEIMSTDWKKTDLSWDGFGVNVWSTVESCCAIIAACLPTMLPLIRRAKTLTKRSRNQSLVWSMIGPQKHGQGFRVAAVRIASNRKSPYEVIDESQDINQERIAYDLSKIPSNVRAEQTAHPVVRSPRYQQERMMAPLPDT